MSDKLECCSPLEAPASLVAPCIVCLKFDFGVRHPFGERQGCGESAPAPEVRGIKKPSPLGKAVDEVLIETHGEHESFYQRSFLNA